MLERTNSPRKRSTRVKMRAVGEGSGASSQRDAARLHRPERRNRSTPPCPRGASARSREHHDESDRARAAVRARGVRPAHVFGHGVARARSGARSRAASFGARTNFGDVVAPRRAPITLGPESGSERTAAAGSSRRGCGPLAARSAAELRMLRQSLPRDQGKRRVERPFELTQA